MTTHVRNTITIIKYLDNMMGLRFARMRETNISCTVSAAKSPEKLSLGKSWKDNINVDLSYI
jgi:hypothetical protein